MLRLSLGSGAEASGRAGQTYVFDE